MVVCAILLINFISCAECCIESVHTDTALEAGCCLLPAESLHFDLFDQIICALVQMCETVNLLTCKGRSCCHQIFVLRHLSKIIGCFNRI